MQRNRITLRFCTILLLLPLISGCVPEIETIQPDREIPSAYPGADGPLSEQEVISGAINWKEFFSDSHLATLVEEGLAHNQELRFLFQEIQISKNEALAKSGAYLPSVELGAEAGVDKVGEYTRDGVVEENHEIEPGKSFPDPLPEYFLGAHVSWEVDIWKKLRNAEKSALKRYLASIEGRRFVITSLIAEIADSYFELCALDNQLEIIHKYTEIQSHALRTARVQKQSARVTELALRRFEAQLAKTKSLQYDIKQKIVVVENRINFLLGRFPQPIQRAKKSLADLIPTAVKAGMPTQLLQNRPDIRKAELELAAANLDIDVARARFYPSLSIAGAAGYSAYDTAKLIESPESLVYSIGGGLTAPFINRREIEAAYLTANAKQAQAVADYERTVLRAFIEVTNQISNIQKLEQSSAQKAKQVKALDDSVQISTTLFNAARADYIEVLLTQREALEARFELIETRMNQLRASVDIYRALGGGWKQATTKTDKPSSDAHTLVRNNSATDGHQS